MKKIKKGNGILANVFIWANFALLLVYCISLLLPLIWMLYSSLKDEISFSIDILGLPKRLMFENYTNVIKYIKVSRMTETGMREYGLASMALYSVIRSVASPFLTVACQACVAYVLSKYKFVGSRFIYNLGIVIMILPIVGSTASTMFMYKKLGVYDNLFLKIITGPSNIFGLHFLILYGTFKGLPWSYAESAFIDGAGHFKVLFSIMLPLALPTCSVLFVLDFLNVWNDYQTSLLWLPSYPNLAYGLWYFQLYGTTGGSGATMPMVLAGFAIIMTPTVILYLSAQKLIVSKFTVGGLKG